MIHYHVCYECESEWECYDVDCVGANMLLCELCDDVIAVLPGGLR